MSPPRQKMSRWGWWVWSGLWWIMAIPCIFLSWCVVYHPFDAPVFAMLVHSTGGILYPVWPYIIGGLTALSCGCALFAFLQGCFTPRRHTKDWIGCHTETGQIQISPSVVETLVLRTARRVRGVHGVTVRIVPLPESPGILSIGLQLVVDGERSLPSLATEIEQLVRERVEQVAGIGVADVAIGIAKAAPLEHTMLRV